METSTHSAGIAEGPAWRDPFIWFAVVLLVLYAMSLGWNMRAYGAGADPSGYLNNAMLLGSGRIMTTARVVPGADAAKFQPMTFVPYAFRPGRHGKIYPVYSTGLPLAVAGVALLTGWKAAPGTAMLAMGMLGIAATVWLGRELGLPRRWALLGGMLVAASPVYFAMSTVLMSDVPALVSVTCAVALAWKSRGRGMWALAAGVAMAYAVFVRPTNALAVLPVAVCLGFSWRRWLLFDLGGFPGAVLWLLYNKSTSGHLFETGYGSTSMLLGWLFSWGVVRATWLAYARWLPILFTPVAVFAIGLPLLLRRSFAAGLMLIAWMLAFLCFYSADHDTAAKWNLRYLLPVLPACIAGGLLVLRHLAGTAPGKRFIPVVAGKTGLAGAFLAAAAVIIFSAAGREQFSPDYLGRYSATYKGAADWTQAHLPGNAVITGATATGSLFCYTKFTIARWEWLDSGQWAELVKLCAATHRPIYAVVVPPYDLEPTYRPRVAGSQQPANARQLIELLPGKWTRIGNVDRATFWQLQMNDVDPAKPGAIPPRS